jgi:hypothetical protein
MNDIHRKNIRILHTIEGAHGIGGYWAMIGRNNTVSLINTEGVEGAKIAHAMDSIAIAKTILANPCASNPELIRSLSPSETPYTMELMDYLINTIYPQYEAFDGGHNCEHINQVANAAMYLNIINKCGVTLDILLTAAYCHDIGLGSGDRENHEQEGKHIFLKDATFTKFFTKTQINEIAYAIGAHRASRVEPVVGYLGQLISDADRGPCVTINDRIIRSCKYNIEHGITDPTKLCDAVYDALYSRFSKKHGYSHKPYFVYTQRQLDAVGKLLDQKHRAKKVIMAVIDTTMNLNQYQK